MKTKVLLVGGRSKAKSLALSLLSKSYQVSIINKNYEDCLKLAEIENLNVIHGDGAKPYVLEDANIREMDIVIALTSYDEDNLVICELCKTQFNVKKTLTLISDPKKTEFFFRWV